MKELPRYPFRLLALGLPLSRSRPHPDSRPICVDELDAAFLQREDDAGERFRPGRDRTVEALHALNRAKRHFRLAAQRALSPAQHCAGRPNLPSGDDGHGQDAITRLRVSSKY